MGNKEQSQNSVDGLEDDQVTLESQDGFKGDGQEDVLEPSTSEIEALKEELRQTKEQGLRAAAEAQNVRRRAEQDVERAHKFGMEKLVNDMLPVVDNLERAIEAASAPGAEISAVVEGVELTLKSLVDGLNRHKVETLDPHGEPFNPELHQAMTMVPNPDVEPNTVVEVFQKGYTLHGRLVRPAMVVVSKAAD